MPQCLLLPSGAETTTTTTLTNDTTADEGSSSQVPLGIGLSGFGKVTSHWSKQKYRYIETYKGSNNNRVVQGIKSVAFYLISPNLFATLMFHFANSLNEVLEKLLCQKGNRFNFYFAATCQSCKWTAGLCLSQVARCSTYTEELNVRNNQFLSSILDFLSKL